MIIYLLNKAQKAVKAISTTDTVEAKYTEGINEANKLTLSVPLKNRLDPNIFYALIPTKDTTNYLMFKLNDENVQNDRVSYTGIDAAYDELKSYGYIKEIHPVARTAKEILQRVLEGTRWEVGYVDGTPTVNTMFYYQTYLECIQKIVQLFNVEVTFTYGFNTATQEISGRRVNLFTQQGRRTGKRFEYGSNLLEVTREEDSQNIATAIVGRGKGEEKYDDDGEATGGYGRRINFSDVVWSKANGDPADKPAGQEFVEDKEATKIFGYDDGTPRIAIMVFEDIEDPTELLSATWSTLKTAERPKVSFKAKVTNVGNLQLGDTIAIIRHDIGIEYFTRVYKVTHDLNDSANNTVEMGDDMSNSSLTSYMTNISQSVTQANNTAEQASVAAGSKNKNFYSTTKPRIANEGDNLFLNLGNGDFEYWIWHNNAWEFVQSTKDLHLVEQKVDQVKKDAENDRKNAENSRQEFDKSLRDLNTSIDGIQREVSNNKGEISTLKQSSNGLQASVTNNTNKLTTLSQTVDGIQTKVNEGLDASTIQQLKDQINLKVSKDDILSEINLTAGTTLIKNKKIYMDAESTVFSGKAFIPNAAITNINADKINTGTLDAGKINVININADNITSGIIQGTNSYFDLNQGIMNVRNSKDESVFLKDGKMIFTAFKDWNGYSDIYGQISMNSTKSYHDYAQGMMDIYAQNGFCIRDGNITLRNNANDPKNAIGWDYEGEGNLIWAPAPDLSNPKKSGMNIFSPVAINLRTGKANYGVLNYDDSSGITLQNDIINIEGKLSINFSKHDASVAIWSDLQVYGSKNAIVPTSKGMAAINAYETAEYYFGDIGKSKTDKNGQVLIKLDSLFLETVNTSIPYHVFVSAYTESKIWVEQMNENSFVVKSDKSNVDFSWEIKAKRKGYENNRLEITNQEIPKVYKKGKN